MISHNRYMIENENRSRQVFRYILERILFALVWVAIIAFYLFISTLEFGGLV